MTSDSDAEAHGALERVRGWFGERGLTRARNDRWVAGVCAAFARRYDLNPVVVRAIAVASVVLPGAQVLAYVALWIAMPTSE